MFFYIIFSFTPETKFWDIIWYLNNYTMIYALSMSFPHKYIRKGVKLLSANLIFYTILRHIIGLDINSDFSLITMAISTFTVFILGCRNNIIKSGFFR